MKREGTSKSVLSNLVTNVFNIIIGLLTSIIVTKNLGPLLKGQYNGLLLLSSFYAPMLLFGYANGVLFYGLRGTIDFRKRFWSGFLLVILLGGLAAFILFFLSSKGYLGSIVHQIDTYLLKAVLVSVPIIMLNAYCMKIMRIYSLFSASNTRSIIASAVTISFYAISFFMFDKMDLEIAIHGLLLNQVVQMILNVLMMITKIKVHSTLEINSSLFKPFKYGIQTWVNEILASNNDKFDQLVLNYLIGASSFGFYVVGVSYSNLATNFSKSYINVFFNKLVESPQQVRNKIYQLVQRMTFLSTTFFALGFASLSYVLVPLFYGESFRPAIIVIWIYLPGLVFQVGARINIKFYSALGRPLKNSIVYLSGLVVSLPFYFILVPLYGIKGAAISSTIAYCSSFLYSFNQLRRDFELSLYDSIIFKRSDILVWREKMKAITK